LSSPKVSVIIPAYNEEAHIHTTVTSLLKQDYPNVEIVVIDDGSTDRTLEILKEFNEQIVILQNTNKKPATSIIEAECGQARRLGFKNSTGEFILHFDGHSIVEKNFISTLVNEIPDDAVCIGCEEVTPSLCYAVIKIVRNALFPNRMLFAMYRRSFIEEIGGFPVEDDAKLNIILESGKYKKAFTKDAYVWSIWRKRGKTAVRWFIQRMIVYGNARAFFCKKYGAKKQKYLLISILSIWLGYGFGFILGLLNFDVRRKLGW